MKPLVSIITPLFNAGRFIDETIRSVTAQTFTGWEWIVVNDCSLDDGPEKIFQASLRDMRIRLIHLEKNAGTGMAKAVAMQHARGRYIAFIDSDDLWEPVKLERQLDFMKRNHAPISYTCYRFIDEMGRDLKKTIKVYSTLDKARYLKTTQIGFSTAMVDSELTGNFSFIGLRSREDTHLWIELLGRGFLAYGLDEVLVKYRIHGSSITSNKLKAARQTWELYRHIEKMSIIKSLWFFLHYAIHAFGKHFLRVF